MHIYASECDVFSLRSVFLQLVKVLLQNLSKLSLLLHCPDQHVDIAALLIKYNTCVNATDKWAFTPLHEAAQKGRTQLCALLLAHGADPTMKNQEGQTPLDLATVRTLPSSSVLLGLSRCRAVRHRHQDDFLSCLD